MKTNHLKLLDVREPHELEISALPNAVNIPLGQLAGRLSELDSAEEMVIFCKGWHTLRSCTGVTGQRRVQEGEEFEGRNQRLGKGCG